jgi:hypothetical protein
MFSKTITPHPYLKKAAVVWRYFIIPANETDFSATSPECTTFRPATCVTEIYDPKGFWTLTGYSKRCA